MAAPVFPRLPLFGVFALLGLTVALAAAGSATGVGAPRQTGAVLVQRDLLFEDRGDGAVVALEAGDRHQVAVFEGENGFLRGTLRGFARIRHLEKLGPETPFQLARWSDGRLTLDDPATGRHVELLAFGVTNAGVFARLLAPVP
ncbi:MAG: hypothetical protein NVSMB18_10850 [Acetobacteraceae bacterium]